MNPPQITVRPEKRYDRHGRHVRGARRGDGAFGRTLALFDRWGIRKRPREVRVCLSDRGMDELKALAAEWNVEPSGLAAFMIEKTVRERADA